MAEPLQVTTEPPTPPPPPAPPDLDTEALFQGVLWHQRWEIFRGVFVPGLNPVERICRRADLPADLSGKRVLDIGAWNGCFSFECERRGASEVVALSLEDPKDSGFDRLRDLLGSEVRYVQGSVYGLDPEALGRFDVILFFGVLYHLRYPLLAIDRIRAVSRGDVHVETHLVPSRLLLRRPLSWLGQLIGIGQWFRWTPIWRQYRAFELHRQDQSNWFGPNVAAVVESFASAGFAVRHCRSWRLGARGAFVATATEIPERLRRYSYEGASPLHGSLTGLPPPPAERQDG